MSAHYTEMLTARRSDENELNRQFVPASFANRVQHPACPRGIQILCNVSSTLSLIIQFPFTASNYAGFGLMDAYGLVSLAVNWTTVAPQLTCTISYLLVNRVIPSANALQVTTALKDVTNSCPEINFLEHVQVRLNLNYTIRGDLEINLTSPQGTTSRLTRRRRNDNSPQATYLTNWKVLTLHHWGENPSGIWELSLKNSRLDHNNTGMLFDWSLIIFGTATDPLEGNPHVSKSTAPIKAPRPDKIIAPSQGNDVQTTHSEKQSKRMTAHKRYKIQRKVREHLRKQRKEAKLNGKSKRQKKDPGIPNLFPFKEDILKQAEEKKKMQGEANERRKQSRLKEVNKKRNLESLQKDALKRQKEFERKEAIKENSLSNDYSEGRLEGSLKAYYKEFKKVVEAADVVLEVLDARDPLGCRCPQVEESVLSSGVNKKLVLILNKIDLVPREIVDQWLKYLRNEFPTIAFKASTQSQKQNLHQSKVSASLASGDLLTSSACVGADTLLKLLGNYCRNKDIKTAITVGIVGFPNVGKSSIINSLKRCKACTVGATPGVTKSMQEVHLDKHVKLLDSPGIVMDSGNSDSAVILRNCVKIENIDDPVPAVEAILKRCNKQQVMEKYLVPDYATVQEFLAHLGKRLGKLKKGGIPDINAAGKMVLKDWNSGKIVFYTHPPEEHRLPTHLSADIVSEWSKEFDLSSLQQHERDELHGLQNKVEDAMVLEAGGPVDAAEEIEEEDMESDHEEEDWDDEDDDQSDEGEAMEDSDNEQAEKDSMTVLIKKSKSVTHSKDVTKSREKIIVALKADEMNEFNMQTNKERKKMFKKQQRDKRKQAASHTEAMDESDDDYSFDTDFS